MSVVIVIDPGHGGDNLGGNTDLFIEKELTMKVADAMRDRLMQYDDVEVYLTHENTTDPDLGRKERAKIAKDHGADFVCSLHFNMSEYHTLYGTEVWTSAFGEYYTAGHSFAEIMMQGLHEELGFFDRGIKTRIGKDGDDYYGIILNCKKEGIPAVIIEHCHLDEERDYNFLLEHGEDAYRIFGELDADCVAKYYHLKSDSLGVDYSNYEVPYTEMPTSVMAPDSTDPEYCTAELLYCDTAEGTAQIRIASADPDSPMQYYSLSYDGGETFGLLLPWSDDVDATEPSDSEYITVYADLSPDVESELVVRAYNRYDLYTDSDVIMLPLSEKQDESDAYDEFDRSAEDVAIDMQTEENIETVTETIQAESGSSGLSTQAYILIGIGVIVAALLTMILVMVISDRRRRKRRRKRRNTPYNH